MAGGFANTGHDSCHIEEQNSGSKALSPSTSTHTALPKESVAPAIAGLDRFKSRMPDLIRHLRFLSEWSPILWHNINDAETLSLAVAVITGWDDLEQSNTDLQEIANAYIRDFNEVEASSPTAQSPVTENDIPHIEHDTKIGLEIHQTLQEPQVPPTPKKTITPAEQRASPGPSHHQSALSKTPEREQGALVPVFPVKDRRKGTTANKRKQSDVNLTGSAGLQKSPERVGSTTTPHRSGEGSWMVESYSHSPSHNVQATPTKKRKRGATQETAETKKKEKG